MSKLVKTLENGLQIVTCGRGMWEVQHPNGRPCHYFDSKKEAFKGCLDFSGEVGIVCTGYDEDGEISFSKRLLRKGEKSKSKEEAIKEYKETQIKHLEASIDKLKRETESKMGRLQERVEEIENL